jgi:hypothetical protein
VAKGKKLGGVVKEKGGVGMGGIEGKRLIWLILVLHLFALGGCGGGGGGAPDTAVSVTSVEVLSAGGLHPRSPVSLTVALDSAAELNDLGMAYYLISKDEEAQQIESYHLGSAAIPLVASGENAYTQTFIFSDDVPAGTYNLVVQVDPLECVLSRTVVFEVPDSLRITVAEDRKQPDLVLRKLRPSSAYLVLSYDEYTADNMRRSHIAGTLEVESVAYGASNVALGAFVETNSGYEEVLLWDSASQSYVRHLFLSSLEPNAPKSLMGDVFVPDSVRNRLAGRTFTKLKFVVDPLGAIEENEAAAVYPDRSNDNEIIYPVNIYEGVPVAASDPEEDEVTFQTSFSKGFSNSFFGAEVDFLGKSWFGAQGIGASVSGGVPVTILGHTFDFLRATSDGHYNPIMPTDSAFDLDVEFAGMTLYSKSGNANFSWEESWQIEKRMGYSQTFVIAVVPVELSAGASGALGINASVNIAAHFDGSISPFVDVGAYTSAAINLLVAKGGVRGTLYLVGCTFDTTLGGTIAANAEATQLTGTLVEKAGYTLEGPNGNVELFVNWPRVCWKWHIIPYPCGWNEATKSLVSWSVFSQSDTLLDKQQSVTVSLQ